MFLCAFHCTIYTGNRNNWHNSMYFNPTLFKAISYTVRVRTADDKDGGTEAKAYVGLIGTQACTDKINLELVQKNGFEPGTAEIFSVEAADAGEIRKIEVGRCNCNVNVSSELLDFR